MRRSQRILIYGASWILIVGFVAATIWYGYAMQRLFTELREGSFLPMCGNAMTNPLRLLLSYGAPVAAAGAVMLLYVGHRSRTSLWAARIGIFLTVGTAGALITFGAELFRSSLPGEPPLSSLIWWMGPV